MINKSATFNGDNNVMYIKTPPDKEECAKSKMKDKINLNSGHF